MRGTGRFAVGVAALLLAGMGPGQAQRPAAPGPRRSTSCAAQGAFAPANAYRSVEVQSDDRATFRLCAPDAHDVRLASEDIAAVIPDVFPAAGIAMTRDASGLWSVTTAQAVPPDIYRYAFEVDGVHVPDPQATHWTQERSGIDSTFEVKGPAGDFQTDKPGIAHGTVSIVDYWSASLGVERRAHVYTPPGYMKGTGHYPVLYLVHGAAFSDDSWTSLGHAQYILDNLIAAGKAKPMIVVMPFGHTPPRPGLDVMDNGDFGKDLIGDVIPYVDAHFRTIATADARAMAGFSMGGMHTIRFGLTHPELFHSIGIFSMGLGMRGDVTQVERYEQENDAALKADAKALKLLYLAIGDHDPFYSTSAPTRAMFDKYGIRCVYHESGGGHTFINWRRYFADFAPRLFR